MFASPYQQLREAAIQSSENNPPPAPSTPQVVVRDDEAMPSGFAPLMFAAKRWIDYGSESDKKLLGQNALIALMRKCGLLMRYWSIVEVSTFSNTVEGRYQVLSTLVSTRLPWDPNGLEYVKDLGISVEVFGAIALLHAAFNGDMEAFQLALASVNLELFEDVLYTGLFVATSNGSADIVHALLDTGLCHVDWQTEDKTTCLHQAAVTNRLEVVRTILKFGPDLERRCKSGETALFKICGRREHEEVFQLLLREGAKLHTHNKRGEGPLRAAEERGDYDSFETISQRGLDPVRAAMCEGCRLVSSVANLRGWCTMY